MTPKSIGESQNVEQLKNKSGKIIDLKGLPLLIKKKTPIAAKKIKDLIYIHNCYKVFLYHQRTII